MKYRKEGVNLITTLVYDILKKKKIPILSSKRTEPILSPTYQCASLASRE